MTNDEYATASFPRRRLIDLIRPVKQTPVMVSLSNHSLLSYEPFDKLRVNGIKLDSRLRGNDLVVMDAA